MKVNGRTIVLFILSILTIGTLAFSEWLSDNNKHWKCSTKGPTRIFILLYAGESHVPIFIDGQYAGETNVFGH